MLGYSQATPVKLVRIADATTPFDQNLSEGTHIYNRATEELWSVTAGIASTATLTTGSASLKLVGTKLTEEEVQDYIGAMVTGNTETLINVTYNDTTGKLNFVVDNDLANYDNSTSNFSTGAHTTVSDAIYGAGWNGDTGAASKNAIYDKIESLAAGGATQLSELSDVNTSTATNRNVLVADGTDWESRSLVEADISDLGTYLTSEVDGSVTNEIQTLDQSQLNGKNLELSLSSDGEATKSIDLSSVNYTVLTESFEEDDGTATAHSLTQTAITGLSATVSINGTVLKPADYTFTTTTLTIGVPVSQYDQIVITYSY